MDEAFDYCSSTVLEALSGFLSASGFLVFHVRSLPREDFLALAAVCLFGRREAERRHQTVDELAKLGALQEKIVTGDVSPRAHRMEHPSHQCASHN